MWRDGRAVECTGLERQCKTLVTTRNQGKLVSVQKSVQNVLFCHDIKTLDNKNQYIK